MKARVDLQPWHIFLGARYLSVFRGLVNWPFRSRIYPITLFFLVVSRYYGNCDTSSISYRIRLARSILIGGRNANDQVVTTSKCSEGFNRVND